MTDKEDIRFLLNVIDVLTDCITEHPVYAYKIWNDQLASIRKRACS